MAPPKNTIIRFNEGVVEKVRLKYNYNNESMKEAINILQEWIKQQPHFRKKDFPPYYLENCLIGRKGSIEKCKSMIDKLCTMRTLMPQYFDHLNAAKDLHGVSEYVSAALLPKPTKDNYRVFVLKVLKADINQSLLLSFYRCDVMSCEYMRSNDYQDGLIYILDVNDINILELTMNLDLVMTKQMTSILLEGFGMRLIAVHVISDSTLVGSIVNILKMILGEKLSKRILVHKTLSDLHKHVDKKILPKEYDGEECSLRQLHGILCKEFLTERNMEHLNEMSKATTDETYRSEFKFNEEYAGVAGTFRALHLD